MDERVTMICQEALANGIYKMVLNAPEAAEKAQPGQFVNLYCDDKSRLLPRPISICDADPERGTLTLIYAVVGKGTEEFAKKQAGDTIRLLGPLGHGFPLESAKDAAEVRIVGGGLGMPPLLLLAKRLGITTQGMDENGSFGDGTLKAVNQVLKKGGYVQNGIAGEGFVKYLAKLIKAKV